MPVPAAIPAMSVVPVTSMVVAVEISVGAGVNGGMTVVNGTRLGRGNCEDGDQDQAQSIYGIHGISCNSTV
jgi:hypothetical protein